MMISEEKNFPFLDNLQLARFLAFFFANCNNPYGSIRHTKKIYVAIIERLRVQLNLEIIVRERYQMFM